MAYSQQDPRWAGSELGYNNDAYYNMYHFGCLVTAVANMLADNGNPQADPGAVNQWLKDHNGFEAGGGNMIWEALQPLLDQVSMVSEGFSSDLGSVNGYLQDVNCFAIAWITAPNFPQHWSEMPFVNTINDSWDGVEKSVDNYTFHGAHLFRKVVPNPAPPAPAPVVTPPPLPAPIVVPTPVPGTVAPVIAPPVDLPVVHDPEWVQTYKENRYDATTKQDSHAVDMTSAEPIIPVPAGSLIQIAGTFTDNSKEYVRTVYSAEHDKWYGLPKEAFDDSVTVPITTDTQPSPHTVDTTVLTDPPAEINGAPLQDPPQTGNLKLEAFMHFLATILAPILRLIGRKQ